MIINQFSTQKSCKHSSQVRDVQKKQCNFFIHALHCQQGQYFGKSEDPLIKVLVQDFQSTYNFQMKLVTTHGQLTAAAQLVQMHLSFLTIYVSRHNYSARFTDWNYWFSHLATYLEIIRCAYWLVRIGEHRKTVTLRSKNHFSAL